MKVKELKEDLVTCNDDLEVRVMRDGDIPCSEAHQVEGAYIICEATEDFKSFDGVYLIWDDE